jgi:hypothetical protein
MTTSAWISPIAAAQVSVHEAGDEEILAFSF